MEKLLFTRSEAAQALSISVDTLNALRSLHMIKTINIGSLVYIAVDELKAFITKEGALC